MGYNVLQICRQKLTKNSNKKEEKMNYINSKKNSLLPRRVDLFSEVSRDVDQVLNEVFGSSFFDGKKKGYPLVDVIRDNENKSLILQYTVPGVKQENLNVEIENDEKGKLVTVSGKLSIDYTHKESNYQIRELSSQEFRRVVRLPEDVTEEDPKAVLKDGVLKLVFKTKVEEVSSQVRKINITNE
jgi:HSP20 family molecular chaperone IbpA